MLISLPTWLLAAVTTVILALGRSLLSICVGLVSEDLIKRLLVHGIERLAKKTATDVDNQLASDLRASWKIVD